MKKLNLVYAFIFAIFLIGCATKNVEVKVEKKEDGSLVLPDVIEKTTDNGFGGFYLNIEKAMEKYKISRSEAHEIQNQMRDELFSISGSLSVYNQHAYLDEALKTAIYNVTVLKQFESGFKPTYLRPGSFYLVLDLDETLLTQWYANGLKPTDKRKAHLGTSTRDKVIRSVDRKTGQNLEVATIINGPNTVTFRPKLNEFFRQIKKIKGYAGFIIFTAKDDDATWDIINRWKQMSPRLFKDLKGVFTRNYLRYGFDFSKPSKDLRIIDESLKHVILIDDNESRVVQKNLNYRIPKFNADYFWDIYSAEQSNNTQDEKWIFESVLDFVASTIKKCHGRDVVNCFEQRLGTKDSDNREYYAWLKNRLPRLKIDEKKIKDLHLFHQPFSFKDVVPTSDKYPEFSQGKTKI